MSDPQLPPVPPTAPNGNSTNPPQPPQQQQFASAPPAASALPANPQYPVAPPYGTPQPPYGQQAPQQAPAYGQPQAQPQPQPYGQQTPQQSAYAHPGAAPYASTQQQPAYGAAPATTRPAGSTNTLARVAFIIALAVAAIGALQVLIQPFLLSSIGYYSTYGDGGYGVFTLLFGIVSFLASAAALVLGLIAVRRPGGQVFAGIAIGVGGVQLLGIVLGWISSLFYAFL
ncbi:hypothetical protein ACFY9N_15720 [Microbacterium sp. NPDC008134]|uniref:hypothetical protein n=1 Tax=Microbacterium sp. NPDC008134 TaxID=3364183 RepID=UPI0036F0A478